jgi:LasA protease
MGVAKSTRSGAKKLAAGLVLMAWLFSVLSCNMPLLNLGNPDAALPTIKPSATFYLPSGQSKAYFPGTTEVVDTPTPSPTQTLPPPVMYYAESGDTLAALAARFQVSPQNITPAPGDPAPGSGLLKIGQLFFIPRDVGETAPATKLLPDSEVVFSPSAVDFDIREFVKQAGGYLSTFSEYTGYGTLSGADLVNQIALDNSINPRLLLAILEYQGHWVYGSPGNLAEAYYPIEKNLYVNNLGLYSQVSWAAHELEVGYYGWRTGALTAVTFMDGSQLRLAPEVNAGTAALEHMFARLNKRSDWNGVLFDANGFLALYERMYGNYWDRDQEISPLLPDDLTQPPLDLPFFPGIVWSFTGGPHAVWGKDTPFAAIDFAPGSTQSGCVPSETWVLAPAAGLVLRSGNGLVVLDLDGDGHEQTGWVLMFLHIRTDGRAYAGQRLNKDDPIGHPSCEGGSSTGTHTHIARKYNGEWIPADGPLPFVLSGWQVHAGNAEYKGTLTKDGQTITADTNGAGYTQITRPKP